MCYLYIYIQEGVEEGEVAGGEKGKKGKRLKNQFNFSERASQTFNNPYRVGCYYIYMYVLTTCAHITVLTVYIVCIKFELYMCMCFMSL